MNPTLTTAADWARDHAVPLTVAAAVLAAALMAGASRARRRPQRTRPPAAVVAAALAAAACTAYSADTSWRFAEHWLDMASAEERAAMFAAGELALFACALMARQNLRSTGTPGAPGVLVWAVTGVQVIPAYAESGIVGGTVRAVIGPIMAALLWHLAMGIELRHRTPGARSNSLAAVVGREARERLLSRLGLAVRGRDAEQISRDRATDRAVRYAARLAANPTGRGHRRTERRLAAAVARAHVGQDEAQRQRLMALLAARRSAASLATVPLTAPWERPEPTPAELPAADVPAVPEPAEYVPGPVPAARVHPPQAVPADARLLPIIARPEPAPAHAVAAAEGPRVHPQVHAEYVPEPPAEVEYTPNDDGPDPADERPDDSPPPPAEDSLTAQAREDFRDEMPPSVRRLKETYRIGQARAMRIRDELTASLSRGTVS
ncbi:hypothetical protein [Streptomyces youssoufiensis]